MHRHDHRAFWIAAESGAILIGWFIVQVAMIGYVSILQLVYLLTGMAVLALTWLIHGRQVQ